MEDFRPISEILALVQQRTGMVLRRSSISSKVLTGPSGRESMIDRLQRLGLATTVQHGSRQDWLVAPAAVDLLVERVGGRPGKSPGAQVTLDQEQVLTFARHVVDVGSADEEAIQEAVRAATGLSADKLAEMERVVIPRAPRAPRKR